MQRSLDSGPRVLLMSSCKCQNSAQREEIVFRTGGQDLWLLGNSIPSVSDCDCLAISFGAHGLNFGPLIRNQMSGAGT